jgi:hypothetical protein
MGLRLPRAAAVAAALLLAAVCPVRADLAAGLDFQVNTYTTGHQRGSHVDHFSDGDFVVVWESVGSDGNSAAVAARRFAADGTPHGPEFLVDGYAPWFQRLARVATDPADGFTIVWETRDFSTVSVLAQRFDSAGQAAGTEVVVDAIPGDEFATPDVEHDSAGNFTVVWRRATAGDPEGVILARNFDAGGAPLGSEIQVSTYATGEVFSPRISMNAADDFVVVWASGGDTGPAGSDGDEMGVAARLFDSGGAPLGTEFVVNTYTPERQYLASVDHDAGGNFVVVWTSSGFSQRTIRAQRFDGSGSAVGSELLLDPGSLSGFSDDLLVDPDGGFLALWSTNHPGTGQGFDAYIRRFDSAGAATTPEEFVSDHLPLSGFGEALSSDAAGNFVVTWMEGTGYGEGRDGSGQGVFARRFCREDDPTCDVCVGFDDLQDADGDAIADGCDPCTNVGGAREAQRATVDVLVNQSSIPQRASRIVVGADFVPAGGAGAFALLDPASQGMRFRVEAPSGAAIMDTTLPAGTYTGTGTAGWRTSSVGDKWTYLDKREISPTPLIFKVLLKDRSAVQPGLVRMRARGKRGAYDASEQYTTLTASIALGDEAAASAGLCAEATFIPEECNAVPAQVRCRR